MIQLPFFLPEDLNDEYRHGTDSETEPLRGLLLRQIHLFERIVVRAEDRVHAFFAYVRISLSVSRRRGYLLPPFILLLKWEEQLV